MKLNSDLIAIITGGSSGLGKATAQLLRNYKVKVIIADVNEKQGIKVSQQYQCDFIKTNVADQESVKYLFKWVIQKYGKVDVLINCAAVFYQKAIINKTGTDSSEIFFEKLLKINVIGTFNMCKWGAKYMSSEQKNGQIKQKGVIINVASVAGLQGSKGQVVYSATKGAIVGMTLPMARDLGKYGIRVMCIAPGLFDTPMAKGMDQKLININKKMNPSERFGNPYQFGLLVKGIIQNQYASGSVWRLDGAYRVPYF